MGARAACVTRTSFEPLAGAEAFERELSESTLGAKLIEVLRLAQDIDTAAAKRDGRARLAGQKRTQTLEEKLAEALLNAVGSPDDCFMIRQFAEWAAEAA